MLEATLPAAIGLTGLASALAIKAPDLLKDIYGDIARPGASQVGKALSTVLGLGNTILIPLRLLNEAGRVAETRTFSLLADRLQKTKLEDINEIPPEIGVEALDRMSSTADESLRNMYAALLATAACEGPVKKAHPSFVRMIVNLSPDEALLLRDLSKELYHPFIRLAWKSSKGGGNREARDLLFKDFERLSDISNIPLYISNLSGLGLIEIRRDAWLSDKTVYQELFDKYKRHFSYPDSMNIAGDECTLVFDNNIIVVTDLGRRFIAACVDEPSMEE